MDDPQNEPGRAQNLSQPGNRYRCYLQLRAKSAELAARLALAVSGAIAVTDVIRIEESA